MFKRSILFLLSLLSFYAILYADLGQMGVEAGKSERCVAVGDPKTKDVRNFGRTRFIQMKALATGENLMFNCAYSKCLKAYPGSKNVNKDSTVPDKKLCCNKIIRLQENGKYKWKCVGKTISTDKAVKEMKFEDPDSENMISNEEPDNDLKDKMAQEEGDIQSQPTPVYESLLDDLKSLIVPELLPRSKK